MMSLEEMFYGAREVVWIVKPDKKPEVIKGEAPPKPPPPTALENAYGPFLPYYYPPYTAPAGPKKPAETKTVDFKVPICCEGCNESVETTLKTLKAVKKVTCDILKQKVTVAIAADASVDEVLLECRTAFKKSRLWSKDD